MCTIPSTCLLTHSSSRNTDQHQQIPSHSQNGRDAALNRTINHRQQPQQSRMRTTSHVRSVRGRTLLCGERDDDDGKLTHAKCACMVVHSENCNTTLAGMSVYVVRFEFTGPRLIIYGKHLCVCVCVSTTTPFARKHKHPKHRQEIARITHTHKHKRTLENIST